MGAGKAAVRDFRNVVSGKIERNDPEQFLSQEIDVYYRYNWALAVILERKLQSLRVLELGCGLGWFGRMLEDRFGDRLRYWGVDLDADAIAEAQRRSRGSGRTQFIQADVCRLEETGLSQDHFDYVVWFENLEHLRPVNFLDLVDTVRRYLKPRGEMLVEVPNRIAGGGLRATGPLRKSSRRYARGQHNPHHYFEPTLEEARFLFPSGRILGFDPGDHMLIRKGIALAWSRIAWRLPLFAPVCHIDHGGQLRESELHYMGVYRRIPSWNRAFLIREPRAE